MPRRRHASEFLFENARNYPATVVLLCVTCTIFLVFGLMCTEDQALLLATNSASPIRIRLWDDGVDVKLRKQNTESLEFGVGRWLCLNVQWVIRFTCGSLIVTTSGTLLATIAALYYIAKPVEESIGLSPFITTVTFIFAFRLVWVLFALTIMGPPASVQYSMQPGLTWLLSALYVYYERALRYANQIKEEVSRLRLFGKIPLGPATVRLVLVVHLAMRDDTSMGLIPGVAAGILLSTSAIQTFLRYITPLRAPQQVA